MQTYRVWNLRNCIITVDLMEVPEYFSFAAGSVYFGGYAIGCIDTTLSWYSNGKFGALAMFCVFWVLEAQLVFATWRVRNPYREWTITHEANARHAWWWCAATLEDRVLKKKSCRWKKTTMKYTLYISCTQVNHHSLCVWHHLPKNGTA